MTKDFENKVMVQRIVDTRNYRYIVKEYRNHVEIRRLPIKDLDTTAALTDWETVKVIK